MEKKIALNDGLIKQNMVFMSGILISPVIACASTLMKALAVCFVFSLVSFGAILFCRIIPRTIVYTLRVTLYSLTAAAFYIPVALLARTLFGMELIASTGVYLPVIVTNSLILSKTETRFYLEPLGDMIKDVFGFIIGFDAACAVTGLLRELLSAGRIAGFDIGMPFTVPALETTFGGFLFVGVFAGIFRGIYNYRKRRSLEPEPEDAEESLAEYAEDVGEFLVGKSSRSREKIRIYRAAAKKAKRENSILDMEFLSNRDVVADFEKIVAQGSGMTEDNKDSSDNGDNEENTQNPENTENSENSENTKSKESIDNEENKDGEADNGNG